MDIQNTKPVFDLQLFQMSKGAHHNEKAIWIKFSAVVGVVANNERNNDISNLHDNASLVFKQLFLFFESLIVNCFRGMEQYRGLKT